jgi:hypothetical protein
MSPSPDPRGRRPAPRSVSLPGHTRRPTLNHSETDGVWGLPNALPRLPMGQSRVLTPYSSVGQSNEDGT